MPKEYCLTDRYFREVIAKDSGLSPVPNLTPLFSYPEVELQQNLVFRSRWLGLHYYTLGYFRLPGCNEVKIQ